MSNLFKRCTDYFNTENLYGVLGVGKDATKSELKKAYHKKSLAYHPDRVAEEEKAKATKKFQVLSQVHSLLSDDGRRAEYDETGEVGEESSLDQDKNWDDYWRLLFPKVTLKDIEEFSEKYKGSEEELSDLKGLYIASEGDMTLIMEAMICCDHDDEPRFTEILQDLIRKEEIPDFENFSKEKGKKKKERRKKAQKEAKEAEEESKKLKLGDSESDLMAMIASRQASRAQQADNFFSHLEAKYGGDSGDSGSRKKRKK